MSGWRDLLQIPPFDSELDLLHRMKRAALEPGQMGDALIAYSRLNERSLDLQPLDPGKLWTGLVEEAIPTLGSRQVDWVIQPLLTACAGDAALVRQALRLLLDNALKFSSRTEFPGLGMGLAMVNRIVGRDSRRPEGRASAPRIAAIARHLP